MTTETQELAVIDAQNAVQIFTQGGLDSVLDGIEAKVRAIPTDPSTVSGRAEIRSLAYNVARTKTALDAEGKKLTEGWREATKKVNEERKRSLDRLDALAEEVRRPLTEFENKEKIRVAGHEAALLDFTSMRDHLVSTPDLTVHRLKVYESDIVSAHSGRNWEEFSTRAGSLRGDVLSMLTTRIASEKRAEQEKKAAAERAAAELRASEERAKHEAEMAAKRERDRIATENKAAEELRAKREANARLRAKIHSEIATDIMEKSANEIADSIMAGQVRHVKVIF